MLPGHLRVVVLGFLPWTHASVIRGLGSLEAYVYKGSSVAEGLEQP